METILRKYHNLTMNCLTNTELQEWSFELYYSHREYRDVIVNLFNYGVIAGEHTRLPIYYFEASNTTGKKQDRLGNFY